MEFEITKKSDFAIEGKAADGKTIFVSYIKHPRTHRHLLTTAKVGDKVEIPADISNQGRYFCTEATMRKTVDQTTGEVTSFLDAQKALFEADSLESQRRQMALRERLLAAQTALAEKSLA